MEDRGCPELCGVTEGVLRAPRHNHCRMAIGDQNLPTKPVPLGARKQEPAPGGSDANACLKPPRVRTAFHINGLSFLPSFSFPLSLPSFLFWSFKCKHFSLLGVSCYHHTLPAKVPGPVCHHSQYPAPHPLPLGTGWAWERTPCHCGTDQRVTQPQGTTQTKKGGDVNKFEK